MSLGVMIRTLGQARRVCDRGKWDKLFVKVQERVKRRLGIKLPKAITIPYPAAQEVELKGLKGLVRKAIMQAPLPNVVRDYIYGSVAFVARSGPKVGHVVCAGRIRKSWSEMEKLVRGGCNWHRLGRWGGRIDGCLSMRTASQWEEVLGPDGDLLKQNLKYRMLIDYTKVETKI